MQRRLQKFFLKLSQTTVRISPMQTIVFAFLGIIFTGTLLLLFPFSSRSGESCGLMTAIFTATSATCVTGLSLVDTWTQWSGFGQVVVLCLIQIGGLGFMTIASTYFFLFRRKINLRQRLVMAQAMSISEIGGVVRLVRNVLRTTIVVELIGATILAVRLIPDVGLARGIWWGIFHAVSAFCNAGFDLLGGLNQGSSITAYGTDWVVSLTLMALIVIGGIGFIVWEDIRVHKRFRKLSIYSKLVLWTSGLLIVGGTVLFWVLEHSNTQTMERYGLGDQILLSAFQSVTCRTAGFWTIVQSGLTDASKAISILLMFIGGSSGSTAGGLKTVTFAILALAIVATARGRSHLTVFKRTITKEQISSAMSLFIILLLLVFCGATYICAVNDVSFLDSLYETVSALATVGVTTGITQSLSVSSKILLICYMFFGRVGIMTISLGFLFANRVEDRYQYAETTVLIG